MITQLNYASEKTIELLIGVPGALIRGICFNLIGFIPTILAVAIFSGIGVFFTGLGLKWLPEINLTESLTP